MIDRMSEYLYYESISLPLDLLMGPVLQPAENTSLSDCFDEEVHCNENRTTLHLHFL
jgi:hypothetical protein